MRVRPYGPAAWLVDELDDPVAWARGLRALDVAGVVEVVPAERTVLVRCQRVSAPAVGRSLSAVVPEPAAFETAPVVIGVRYGGDDLAEVARRTGLTPAAVVERHAAGEYTVAFCGFAPGFAYLRGLDPALHLPRRDTPRTRVPAGAVAIAAHYTAVYPAPSPGGWHLIGVTDERLWDVSRPEPTRLTPGTAVRFEARGPLGGTVGAS
jgi:KipI family sensor histidine kinase inhibitor